MKKKLLFIDRDGTLIWEPPDTFQIDSFSKLKFLPGVFYWLRKIAEELDYELVMVTNQDGLGTASFPEDTFWPVQNFIVQSMKNENINFSEVCIDRSFPSDNLPTRKPGTGMLTKYFAPEYDLSNSFVIGDRLTDVKLAKNLGAKSIFIRNNDEAGEYAASIDLIAEDWAQIYQFLKLPPRRVAHSRNTNETKISIDLNLDGSGRGKVCTGLSFFDHMLEQLVRHGNIDLDLVAEGDLHIDEHHTIEDTGIALGEAFTAALKEKRGINRYGFLLPMDDCLAQVAVDFGGRPWIEWEAEFKREKVGDMPTEMFFHFFKSFSDSARCNLNIKAEGENEHHKIESIFKAFAKAVRMAVKRNADDNSIPTTKGVI